jgi:thioredoxin-like negative regulator of GroEL
MSDVKTTEGGQFVTIKDYNNLRAELEAANKHNEILQLRDTETYNKVEELFKQLEAKDKERDDATSELREIANYNRARAEQAENELAEMRSQRRQDAVDGQSSMEEAYNTIAVLREIIGRETMESDYKEP